MTITERDEAPFMFQAASPSVQALALVVDTALGGVPFSLEVLAPEREQDLVYHPASGTLDEAFLSLAAGGARSLRMRPCAGGIAWILVFAPNFKGDGEDRWTVVLELAAGDPATLLDRLVTQPELAFVVVSVEETLDAPPSGPGADAFPWDHPWLVAAAVPEGAGPLRVRPGPAFHFLRSEQP